MSIAIVEKTARQFIQEVQPFVNREAMAVADTLLSQIQALRYNPIPAREARNRASQIAKSLEYYVITLGVKFCYFQGREPLLKWSGVQSSYFRSRALSDKGLCRKYNGKCIYIDNLENGPRASIVPVFEEIEPMLDYLLAGQ